MAEFMIAKHRSGAVGDIRLRFRNQFARFENWDTDDVPGARTMAVGSSMNASSAQSVSFDNPFDTPSPLGGADDNEVPF